MQGQRAARLRIAGTYVGTVVGAGFASGQEILRFFTAYGAWAWAGLAVAATLLALFAVIVIWVGAACRAESHREVIRAIGGRRLGLFADWVISGFLFAGAGVMMAGSGAIFREQFGLPAWLGSAVMAGAAIVTVWFRLRGVTTVTALVAPVLITAVVTLSIVSVLDRGLPGAQDPPGAVQGAAPSWLIAAALYASYNLVLAVPVLAPLGGEVREPGPILAGGTLGGAALGIGALAIHLGLASGLPETARAEVPMLLLARHRGDLVGLVYGIVLWLEVYTTAVASLYGVSARLRSPRRRGYVAVVTVLGLLAFALSFAGFADLVQSLYPAVGYLGLVILAALAWHALRGGGMPPGRNGRPPRR
ncbi:MAG TPA: hypothetical protein VF282_09880 [Bacillota bacterium]